MESKKAVTGRIASEYMRFGIKETYVRVNLNPAENAVILIFKASNYNAGSFSYSYMMKI